MQSKKRFPKGCSLNFMAIQKSAWGRYAAEHVPESEPIFHCLLQAGRVIYAQTDSLFCVLPGATNMEAIQAAQLAATMVSDAFPKHMEMKFEKVCQPFMLLHVNR
jgi:DNA polymerase elongation subunit (family B)